LRASVVIARHRPLHEIPLHRGSSWRGLGGRTTNDEYRCVVLSSRFPAIAHAEADAGTNSAEMQGVAALPVGRFADGARRSQR